MTDTDPLEQPWPARDDVLGNQESAQDPASAAAGADAAATLGVRLLVIGEVAELLRCSERTIRRWVRGGRLPVVRIGGAVRFRADDVAALLRSGLHGPKA